MEELEFEADLCIVDPKDDAAKAKRKVYGQAYWESRRRTGITQYIAENKMKERNHYGAMMVLEGDADGMISGYSRPYAMVAKPILELIGRAPGVGRVASTNIMITERGPLFLADTTMNIDPTAEQLAEIALMTAQVVRTFGFEPVIAMLSYANFGTSEHPHATKVKQAVKMLHTQHPDLLVDGELQLDFALNKDLHQRIFPFSKIAGKKVNTLVFPNLESANITYKLLKEVNQADSIGPFLMGLKHPIHLIQLGASVQEMVNMAALTAIDAQERVQNKKTSL